MKLLRSAPGLLLSWVSLELISLRGSSHAFSHVALFSKLHESPQPRSSLKRKRGTAVRSSDADASDSADRIGAFNVWLGEQGVQRDGLQVTTFNDGLRGVIATKDFEKGSVVLRVPLKAVLSDAPDQFAEAIAVPPAKAKESARDVHWIGRLSAVLAHHRSLGKASRFQPYVDMLQDPPSLPAEWTEEDVAALQNPALAGRVQLVRDMKSDLFRQVEQLQEWEGSRSGGGGFGGGPQRGSITLEHFEHSFKNVLSRTYLVDPIERRCLVPLLDMMNHNTLGNTPTDVRLTDDEVCLTTNYPIKRGDQVYLNYGEKDNDDLLLYYGFIPANNPSDNVRLVGGFGPHDLEHIESDEQMPPQKIGALERLVLMCQNSFLVFGHAIQAELVTALRIFYATPAECQDRTEQLSSWNDFTDPVSEANEGLVLKSLQKRLKEQMEEGWSTTLEQDRQALVELSKGAQVTRDSGSSETDDIRKLEALRFCIAKKEILDKQRLVLSKGEITVMEGLAGSLE